MVVTDHLTPPIPHLPAAGELVAVDDLVLNVGGGAANTAIDLSRLGVRAAICAKVGDDAFGRFATETLVKSGVDVRALMVDPRRATSQTLIINVGGGPTPDKPTVTLSVPDPKHINSFMNFRVADIQACYELWKSRGAEFITEPIPKYGETRCYIRDPDGYIIEVGQSTDVAYG